MNPPVSQSKDLKLICLYLLITLATVGMTIAGTVLAYSAIPYYDTWDATLGFVMQIKDGHYSQWWAMYYEHRLILARVFFWLDYLLFNCNESFLVCINMLLISLTALQFHVILRAQLAPLKQPLALTSFTLIVISYLFLWSQDYNIIKGFQNQFFMAQLLPLSSFYFLHRSTDPVKPTRYFLISFLLGIGSIGTMANGILVLPMMTIYAMICRMNRKRVVLLAIASALSLLFFIHDLKTPSHHGHPFAYFFSNSYKSYQYIMLFLGNPVHYLTLKVSWGVLLSFLVGQCAVVLALRQAWKMRSNLRENTLVLALVFFIFYVLCSAVMSAGGRSFKGIGYALSSRYTTPTIMAWITFLIVFAPVIAVRLNPANWRFRLLCLALLAAPLPLQVTALHPNKLSLFVKRVAGLATTLQVADKTYLSTIYPYYDEHYNYLSMLTLAKRASEQNLSIFSQYPYSDARQTFGTQIVPTATDSCDGQLNQIEVIKEDPRFLRVAGWIIDSRTQQVPKAIRFLDKHNTVVGYAITGNSMPRIAAQIGPQSRHAGFCGYLLATQIDQQVTLQADQPACQIQIRIPNLQQSQPPQNP
jgi:hypothetical protein